MNLLEGAKLFTGMAQHMLYQQHKALDAAGKILEDAAKDVIGTYDYGWTPLAPSTLAKKNADTPLLETGEMRDSIERTVSPVAFGILPRGNVQVGSNNDKAVWQELGTSRIPPRSFLMETARRKGPEAALEVSAEMIGQAILKVR